MNLPMFPVWLPDACVVIAVSIAESCRSEKEREILSRLASDPKMERVWRELTKSDRASGRFYHPAKSRPDKPPLPTQDEIQAQALSELFNAAFCSARDGISTSTLDQAMDRRRQMTDRAATLRECAEMRRQDVLGGPLAAADGRCLSLGPRT